jgi:hypothetical protein
MAATPTSTTIHPDGNRIKTSQIRIDVHEKT